MYVKESLSNYSVLIGDFRGQIVLERAKLFHLVFNHKWSLCCHAQLNLVAQGIGFVEEVEVAESEGQFNCILWLAFHIFTTSCSLYLDGSTSDLSFHSKFNKCRRNFEFNRLGQRIEFFTQFGELSRIHSDFRCVFSLRDPQMLAIECYQVDIKLCSPIML